jgi:hypothetical protein
MPETLKKPAEVIVLAAKLYRELALSALTLLPHRTRPSAHRTATHPPRLVDVSAQ